MVSGNSCSLWRSTCLALSSAQAIVEVWSSKGRSSPQCCEANLRTGAVFLSEKETDAVLASINGQAFSASCRRSILTPPPPPSAMVFMNSLLACAGVASVYRPSRK